MPMSLTQNTEKVEESCPSIMPRGREARQKMKNALLCQILRRSRGWKRSCPTATLAGSMTNSRMTMPTMLQVMAVIRKR
ncbi:MAG: hypothetical protein A4E31_00913 [Methanomassiliicoccales archaeon PtaU1.Bin030]|nr:MAG: hypothetical protein A4E31_00913 [Methanomassiliicoccales archaeon PtaU1.Bin030]